MSDGYSVYVLWSDSAQRFYTGSCADVQDRLQRHNAGQSKATRYGVPWRLVHREEFPSRAEAVRRECFLKTGRGRDELRRIIGNSV
jgi:putative endonuclease